MKKFAGMVPLTLVLADEGKNGLAGPAPSAVHRSPAAPSGSRSISRLPLPLQRRLDEDRDDDRGAQQQDAGRRQAARGSRRGAGCRGGRATRRRAARRRRRAPHACTAPARARAMRRHTRARRRPRRRAGRRSRRSRSRRATAGAPWPIDEHGDGDDGTETDVQRDVRIEKQRRGGHGGQVRAVDQQQHDAGGKDSRESRAWAHRGHPVPPDRSGLTSL